MVTNRMNALGGLNRMLATAVAIGAASLAPAVSEACDKHKELTDAPTRVRVIQVGDPDGPADDARLDRLVEQLDRLQAELDRVREALAEMDGGSRFAGRAPSAPTFEMPAIPPMPPLPPMPPMPAFEPGDAEDAQELAREWQERARDMQRDWREQHEEMAAQWRDWAQEWQERRREMGDEWSERQRELADEIRERVRERRGEVRERRSQERDESRRGRQAQRRTEAGGNAESANQVVYAVTGDNADKLFELLAPDDVRVFVSRAGKHIAVQGSGQQQEVLSAGLQLLGWIERDATFEAMREGKAESRTYRVGEERADELYHMLAPNDVKVVVSRADDDAVSVSGTPREHEVLHQFLALLDWTTHEE